MAADAQLQNYASQVDSATSDLLAAFGRLAGLNESDVADDLVNKISNVDDLIGDLDHLSKNKIRDVLQLVAGVGAILHTKDIAVYDAAAAQLRLVAEALYNKPTPDSLRALLDRVVRSNPTW